MRAIVIAALLLITVTATTNAQVFVDGNNINETTKVVSVISARIVGSNKFMNNIVVNYGQESIKYNQQISGPDKQAKEYQNPIPVVDLLLKNGWKLVSVVSGNPNLYEYVLVQKE